MRILSRAAQILILLLLLATLPVLAQDDSGDTDLAAQSQNPLGTMISLPFQNNTSFGVGPNDAVTNSFNIQPIYPVTVGSINLINRFILPIKYGDFEGMGSESGLGDLSYTVWASPVKVGKIIWGIGPSFVFPTASKDQLGSGKFSAGIGIVIFTIRGNLNLGFLVQNTWSVAGDEDRDDVNLFFSQYFINYNFPSFYVSSGPIITSNWEAESGQQWTVPFGGGIGKLVRFGSLPVDLQTQVFYNVVKPDNAGDWGLRLQFKMLFPK